MMRYQRILRAVSTLLVTTVLAWQAPASVSRRQAVAAAVLSATTVVPSSSTHAADADDVLPLENRDRKSNKDALIREDYWYMMGKTPPRVLKGPLKGDDPQWNAFGTCESSGGSNSCTYVSLKQRAPAYNTYAPTIQQGAIEFAQLGQVLAKLQTQSNDDTLWQQAADLIVVPDPKLPPPAVDAELKLILLATALTTSPNFPGPSRELLVARFYANEVHHAQTLLSRTVASRQLAAAIQAWHFGRDAWNSYFQVVNRSIVPKVGDKFAAITE